MLQKKNIADDDPQELSIEQLNEKEGWLEALGDKIGREIAKLGKTVASASHSSQMNFIAKLKFTATRLINNMLIPLIEFSYRRKLLESES